MTALRIGFLLPTNKPNSLSLTTAAMYILADAGVSVEVVHPTGRLVDLADVRVRHDLYVLKKTTGFALSLARTPADLAAVVVERNEPVFAQRYHPHEGRDRKMYCIGGCVCGVLKVFPARAARGDRPVEAPAAAAVPAAAVL